jgi:RHS repeat-associated protein
MGTPLLEQAFGYGAASRLQIVSDGEDSATYSFLANSPLVDHIAFATNGVLRMARTNRYDFVNRLLSVTNYPAGGGSPLGFAYGYNLASQRTAMTNASGERWDYKYDYLGQVTNGWKYDSSGYVINDERFAYFFDDIGNRQSTLTNAVSVDYHANLLNQYTNVGGVTWTNDLDGNLISDGTWTNTWDAENRLVAMAKPGQKLVFTYDWKGRRIAKQVWDYPESTNNLSLDQCFVYDGWNLLAVLTPQSSVLQSFTWGLDLSGSLQGAGGVGGLLVVSNATENAHFPAFDGNGNVMGLFSAANTDLTAQYEYGPFGEVIRATGPMAKANPIRFSTKYQDDETDLLYYGYRYYSAGTGRWISRDPISEKGGVNLLGFLQNSPVFGIDTSGLRKCPEKDSKCKDACCVESIDAKMEGDLEDTLSILDYFPDFEATYQTKVPEPKKLGKWIGENRVGGKVQLLATVKGPESDCKFTQSVFIEKYRDNGKPVPGKDGAHYDDLENSGQNQASYPFRQCIGKDGNPSIADIPSIALPLFANDEILYVITTCIESSSSNCKLKKCCITWRMSVTTDKDRKVTVELSKEGAKCE